MRLLLQSHIYFLASFLLHATIVLFLIFGSIHFSTQVESFEATIEFVNPKTEKNLETIANKQVTSKNTFSSTQRTMSSLSSKNLDDIIRAKGIKIKPEDNVGEAIDKKQSDLLGYLRANKLTQETTTKKNIKKPEPVKNPQLASANQLNGQEVPNKVGADIEPESVSAASPTEKTAEKSDTLPPARRIWQKKMEDQSFKLTLKKLVTANWTVPIHNKKKFQIIIEAIIDTNGNLKKIELLESSGLPIIDTAAEKAIRVSTPFPKLPKILQKEKPEFKAIFRFTPDNVVR